MYIFHFFIQVKYACYICNLQPRDTNSYFVDCFQVERQLGGVRFWSCCLRWSPSSVTGACSSREPDGPRLGLLDRFPRLLCVAVSQSDLGYMVSQESPSCLPDRAILCLELSLHCLENHTNFGKFQVRVHRKEKYFELNISQLCQAWHNSVPACSLLKQAQTL